MNFKSFMFCLFFPLWLWGNTTLLERLGQAQVGDYFVLQFEKTYTFLKIHSQNSQALYLEEIVVPEGQKVTSFTSWYQSGALGHTSWRIYELNLKKSLFTVSYAPSQGEWQKIHPQDQLLSRLLSLPLEKVPLKERKKVGLALHGDTLDERPLWTPPFSLKGKKVEGFSCEVAKVLWPQDGTPLSGKVFYLYLPEKGPLPSYFPIWIETVAKGVSFKMRVIDMGHLETPSIPLPKRPFKLISSSYSKEGNLYFILQNPSSLILDSLVAVPLEGEKSTPLPFSTYSEEETLYVTVQHRDLKLLGGKLCYFNFIPLDYNFSIRTPNPIAPYVSKF